MTTTLKLISNEEKVRRYEELADAFEDLLDFTIENFPHDFIEGQNLLSAVRVLLSRLKARESLEYAANEVFKDLNER